MLRTFDDLVESRRQWIDEVLVPWCRQASRDELLQAEQEWENLAGRVDPQATLWKWAWSRFPALVHETLSGLDESRELRITLADGAELVGYPDNRRTEPGRLVLLCTAGDGAGDYSLPVSINDITAVEPLVSGE